MDRSEEIIRTYRGWDRLERRMDPAHPMPIIDFDQAPAAPRRIFRSRQQVIEKLRALQDSITPTNEEEEYIKARLQASIYFCRALVGEEIPYEEYVENTVGLRPELIAQSAIDKQRDLVFDLLSELGYGPAKKPIRQFIEDHRLGREELLRGCEEFRKRVLPLILDSLELAWLLPTINYRIRAVVRHDEYWMCWARNDAKGYLLIFNFNRYNPWLVGDTEFMPTHEVGGHFVEAAYQKWLRKKGRLDSSLVLTLLHTPDQFGSEGIANALSDFLPELEDSLTPLGRLAKEQRVLRDWLNNNAHIWVNSGGSMEDLVDYVVMGHPFQNSEYVRNNLIKWKSDPERRCYQYVYGIACYYHRQWREKLSYGARKKYLLHVYTHRTTPSQLIRLVERLASEG